MNAMRSTREQFRATSRAMVLALGPERSARTLGWIRTLRARERVELGHERGQFFIAGGGNRVYSPTLEGLTTDLVYRTPIDYFCWGYTPEEGDLVVDVGAGVGSVTLQFAKLVGESGRVVSIEASPVVFESLTRTVDVNGLANVTALNLAAGSAKGTVMFSDEGEGWKGNSRATSSDQGSTVSADTLPAIMALAGFGGRRIALLKCNIEGAEVDFLQGLGDSAALVDHFAIECHDFRGQREGVPEFRTYRWVWDWLKAHGFAPVSRVDERAWVCDTIYASRLASSTPSTPSPK